MCETDDKLRIICWYIYCATTLSFTSLATKEAFIEAGQYTGGIMIGKVVSQNGMKTRVKRFYLSLHYFEFICTFFSVDLQMGMELVGDNKSTKLC